jgi:Zn-dependent peptidase ImmA (M78 family)
MGCIRFGAHGPTSIRIQKHLDNWQNVIINRRCRSTLAHECSHGILHSGLFAELWKERRSRNPGRDGDVLLADGTENLDETPVESRGEEWLEHQANRLMASLLLPMPLVIAQIGERWLEGDPYSRLSLKDRRALARPLAEAFDVNPVLARHRLEDIFCKVVPRLRYLADSGKPDTYRTIPNFCHPPEVFLEALAA